jgi:hypothetical protein
MATLDETLFGRIAVLNEYLRKDQLEESLRIQRSESPPRNIGEILLQRGYITEEQFRTILEIRRKKVRKLQRKPAETRESNRTFGDLALTSGRITLADLEDAVLEQQRLALLNLRFFLGEVLVARCKLPAEVVLDILKEQGKTILVCALCDFHYNVVRYKEAKKYRCFQCDAELMRPTFLDTIAVDGIIAE